MDYFKRLFAITFILLLQTPTVLAGTPQLNLDCKSASGKMSISGFPRGEGYDLKIRLNDAVLRFVDICNNEYCTKRIKQGDLFVVEDLNHKVFTIYFSQKIDNENVLMGTFYALPDTIVYTKTERGYRAKYKAIYDGTDPRKQKEIPAYMDKPEELTCSQTEEL